MPPEPLYPDTPIATRHQEWLWEGHAINLADELPPLVRAAVLAHQDATSDEDRDIAAVLVWTVELHPSWDGPGCATCGTRSDCPDQQLAAALALEFLIRGSAALIRRSQAAIARLDQKRAAS